jgi:hypothetical protein
MAEFQDYTSIGTVLSTDITLICNDPSGTPATKQVTMEKLFNDMALHAANVTRSTLTADGTLTIASDVIQWFDPNGTARTIFLPGTETTNHGFYIKNIGSNAAETMLTVQTAGSVTLATLPQSAGDIFVSDGSEYKRLNKNKKVPVQVLVFGPTTTCATALNVGVFYVPSELHGYNLVGMKSWCETPGTTNSATIRIYNSTDGTSMLTANMTIPSGSTYSIDGTIDATHDDIAFNDKINIDLLSVSTTAQKGLVVNMDFQLP